MSLIDYGVLVRKNGKIINKNCTFMEKSDMDYICDYCTDKYGNKYPVKGYFTAYVGDADFLICFYKETIAVISKKKELKKIYDFPFEQETLLFDNSPEIIISRIDKTRYRQDWDIKYENLESWKDYVNNWYTGITGDEQITGNKALESIYNRFLRLRKSQNRYAKNARKYFTSRHIAEWAYKGNHYEVIFGYGIDNEKDVWDSIKNNNYAWKFSDKEIKVIDNWFKGD